MEYRNIEQLNNTGLVTAIYTTIKDNAWKYGKDGALDNCRRLAEDLKISTDYMVMISQKHTDRIKKITLANKGEMVTYPTDDNMYDGMITNERNILLCTLEADCVPVYLLDPVNKAIGMVHSGWRGTAANISVNAVNLMRECYNSRPENILAAIGPCICASCYEVGEELVEDFSRNYNNDELKKIFINHKGDKFHLDLKQAIIISLERIGVKAASIYDTGICTKESPDLCSWRRDNPVMRSMLTGLMLN